MSAPSAVVDLVERFERNVDAYKRPDYNETQVRREFIDPLFEVLGWDVNNRAGFAEQYKDVIHEDAIKVGGATKAPDYCFRIGGMRKFFVEAKKPSVNVKDDINPAYQLRRYAWSAKLPLSVLTDFEEFAIYDCRGKPTQTDKSSQGRVQYLKYTDYLAKWDQIAGVFSKDAILKGSFDKYAEHNKGKRGTAEVDAAFLAEIEIWRETLARNIALRNPGIGREELNYAVQVTIDRIIFLRICEDRGVEDYGRLMALRGGDKIYPRLCKLFRDADDRYNSGLFHFSKEKDRPELPDKFTLSLNIDDKPLNEMLKGLYYPESPYEFSMISADILGQVYEQFLGKVIRLTEGGQAKVEEKPEVRKAGGVYYTPTYIVDYIVQNTVGKLLENKTPKEVEKLRVLDPACGSGSFLIGAYQFLLDWHLKWYLANDPDKWAAGKKPAIVLKEKHGWRLTLAERKKIVLSNIFGVDIDPQAVEVTKLSLCLKVLEGETSAPVLFAHERALPDFSNNIKCGNSLIGPDFYDGKSPDLFDHDDRRRINVFDWQAEFPAIMKSGGFDAVIGNPPYGAMFSDHEVEYLRLNYDTPANSLDSFLMFTEKSAELLRDGAYLGYIIPSGWVSTPSSLPLRRFFLATFVPQSFVTLPFGVFPNAYIDAVIFTAKRSIDPKADDAHHVELIVFPPRFRVQSADEFVGFRKVSTYRHWTESKNLDFLITASKSEADLVTRIGTAPGRFGDFVVVKRGIEVFAPISDPIRFERPERALTGTLQRYDLRHGPAGFIDYTMEIQQSKPIDFFDGKRILLRQVLSRSLRLQATIATERFLTNQSVQSLLLQPDIPASISLEAILGVLNSRLISWFFKNTNSVARRDDFPKIIIKQTRELPFPVPPGGSVAQDVLLDKLALNVCELLKAIQRLTTAKTPNEESQHQRTISASDRQIDQLVYALFGLTGAEIRIVEATEVYK